MSLSKLAALNLSYPGDLSTDKTNQLGVWLGNNAPKLLSPFARAVRPIHFKYGQKPGEQFTSPWYVNSPVMGGLAGAGIGGLVGMFTGNTGKGALLGGLLGGLGLTGLGAMRNNPDWASKLGLVQRRGVDALNASPNTVVDDEQSIMNKYGMQKVAYGMTHGDPVTAKIYRDTALTLRQKNELATQVGYLNAQQKRRLNQLVAGAFGGGVGMLVAKYLLGLGKFGTILTAIVSGLSAASAFGGRSPKAPYDSMGRPYYM